MRAPLVLRDPTIDLDSSDIEVFGSTKQGVGWNYAGMRSGRVHLASWAQAELPLAMDLMAGNDDVRPHAGELLRRALKVLPTQVCGRPRVRADAGYFDAALAHAAVEADCDFAIAAKRNPAAWRAFSAIPDDAWQDARDMPGAQVAACDYAPAGWPEGTYTIVRRVKIGIDKLSADPRSRRRRTVQPDQLTLASRETSTTSGQSASSSPTSPPTTTTSSGWRPGFATTPPSRNASGKASSAPGSTTFPPPTPPATACGSGPACSPVRCR